MNSIKAIILHYFEPLLFLFHSLGQKQSTDNQQTNDRTFAVELLLEANSFEDFQDAFDFLKTYQNVIAKDLEELSKHQQIEVHMYMSHESIIDTVSIDNIDGNYVVQSIKGSVTFFNQNNNKNRTYYQKSLPTSGYNRPIYLTLILINTPYTCDSFKELSKQTTDYKERELQI